MYFKRPTLLFAIRQAIKLGLLHGDHGKTLSSAEEFIEKELAATLRRVAPKLRRNLFQLGLVEQGHTRDGIALAVAK